MPSGKVVQTALDKEDYERLRKLVKQRGLSIKDAVRDAVKTWVAEQADLSEDPFVKLQPVRFRVKLDCTDHDRVLYGAKE